MNEFDWIKFLKSKIRKTKVVLTGIGDDCAVIKLSNKYYLVSSDLFIENVHFRIKNIPYRVVGQRAIARAFSDIAACGGLPKFVGVSMGLPYYVKEKDLKEIVEGVVSTCKNYRATIIGGDTARAGKLFIDIWVIGEAKRVVLRSQAKSGDYIFVTGILGKLRFNKLFRPKIKEASYLVKRFKINSMIDISDGFIIDLYRILEASKKGAIIWKNKIPIYKGLSDVFRGEDYELIFTVDKKEPNLKVLINKFYLVGRIRDKHFGYCIESRKGIEKVQLKGYLHF